MTETMPEWKRRELELERKENAYYDAYTPFEKLVDSHLGYIGLLAFTMIVSFGFGLGIGVLLL